MTNADEFMEFLENKFKDELKDCPRTNHGVSCDSWLKQEESK